MNTIREEPSATYDQARAMHALAAHRELLALAGLAVLALSVFWPGLQAGFVSDSFHFLENARAASFADQLSRFVPTSDTWYRPLTDLVFWFEYRLFGIDPLGYHLVALLCHLGSGLLLYALTRRLTGNGIAAAAAALVFVLAIQAHEVVFDIADLHNALGGTALLAAVYCYVRGSRIAALLFAPVTFAVDETGLLVLPVLALYELVFNVSGSARGERRRAAARGALYLAPMAAVFLGYLLLRTVLTPGGIYNETEPCRTPRCIAVGVMEYVNRLFVRPDALLELVWDYRPHFALASTGGLILIVGVLAPWWWRNRTAVRVMVFGAGWLAGSVLYYVLALWEYIADRFLYVPYMGLAVFVGGIAAAVAARRPGGAPFWKAAAVLAALVLVGWLVMGARMLAMRGELWRQAGEEAASVVEQVRGLVPDPPPDALFIVSNVPHSYGVTVPPGNTGPYLFNNGLEPALRFGYGRDDIAVERAQSVQGTPSAGQQQGRPPGAAIYMSIEQEGVNSRVVLDSAPR